MYTVSSIIVYFVSACRAGVFLLKVRQFILTIHYAESRSFFSASRSINVASRFLSASNDGALLSAGSTAAVGRLTSS